jgi:hypothetical protein
LTPFTIIAQATAATSLVKSAMPVRTGVLTHLPGNSIEGERCLDLRQLQPRWLLCLDLLDVQIIEVAGQLFFIRQQRTQVLAGSKGDDGEFGLFIL